MKRIKLKIARVTKMYTQKEVADYVGIKQSYYSKIENGSAKLSLEQAQALSKLLKINVNML